MPPDSVCSEPLAGGSPLPQPWHRLPASPSSAAPRDKVVGCCAPQSVFLPRLGDADGKRTSVGSTHSPKKKNPSKKNPKKFVLSAFDVFSVKTGAGQARDTREQSKGRGGTAPGE